MKIRLLILITAGALLAGCEKSAQRTLATSNPHVNVDLLFEHEGTKVYRFEDGGEFLYFAVRKEGASMVETTSTKVEQ